MKHRNLMTAVLGIMLMLAGLWAMKQLPVQENSWLRAICCMLTALGCGWFGHGLAGLVQNRILQPYPEIRQQMAIEAADERNIAVAARAKARAYDVMTFVFGALMVAFVFMQVDLVPIVMLVCTYLFVEITGIWYRIRYEREM